MENTFMVVTKNQSYFAKTANYRSDELEISRLREAFTEVLRWSEETVIGKSHRRCEENVRKQF